MANDRTKPGSTEPEIPELTGAVRPLSDPEVPCSMAAELGPVVDEIRQLYTEFGIRPYRVFLVHVAWTGARLGDGTPKEISRREILPTPRATDLSATTQVLRPLGLSEEGSLALDQISAKYSEDDLMGLTPDLQDPNLPRSDRPNIEFYYEVVESRTSDPHPPHRRYVPQSTPSLSRDGFQWKVSLIKQDMNRGRLGGFEPRGAN